MCSVGREREGDLGRKSSLSQRHERVQDTTTLSSQWMQLISVSHLGHLTDYDFGSVLELVLLLQLKQPVEVGNTFFLRMLSPFSRLFFSFSDCVTVTVPWTCTFWGCLRMSLVPSCISEMLTALLKNASGPQAHISQAGQQFFSQNFVRLLLLNTFSLWIRSPLWLFMSHVCCLILFPPMLYLLEIYTAVKEPVWVRLKYSLKFPPKFSEQDISTYKIS